MACKQRAACTLYKHSRPNRAPILIIWVASLGGALHAPVTTYYLLEVGASQMDVGWLGFIAVRVGLYWQRNISLYTAARIGLVRAVLLVPSVE